MDRHFSLKRADPATETLSASLGGNFLHPLGGNAAKEVQCFFFIIIKPDSLVLKEKLLLDLNFENVHNLDYDLIRK